MADETFLYLDSIGWSGLSSIATFLAVLVALFIPLVSSRLRLKNIRKALHVESTYNFNQIQYALKSKGSSLINNAIPFGVSLSAYLKHIRIDVWQYHNVTLAENSSKIFSYYYDYNNRLKQIKENSMMITNDNANPLIPFILEKQFHSLVVKYPNNLSEAYDTGIIKRFKSLIRRKQKQKAKKNK